MRFIFSLLLTVLIVIAVTSWFAFTESKPLVQTTSAEQVENADTVLNLLNGLRLSLKDRYDAKQLTITHRQAQSLVGFVQRAIPKIKADFTFDRNGAIAKFSYQLPDFLMGQYINVQAKILPDDALNIETVTIGAVKLPGHIALGLAEYLANTYTNSLIATVAIEQVDSINMSDRIITVNLNPMDSFLNEAKKVETGGDSSQAKARNIKIAHYLRLLEGMYVPPPQAGYRATSLSYYIHGLMEEAKVQSNREGASATLENEAAILALAAFAGHRQFANFVGDFSFSFDVIPQAKQRPSLAGREDLNLHFIFSAAIKLLSEQGISIAVGEFKELMDRRRGGSGYSFVDLAADLAGAHFAAVAVDPTYAQKVQAVLATEPNEAFFFPSISGLEEGMNKQVFRQKYGEVDSERYKAVVADIEARLQRLPISN